MTRELTSQTEEELLRLRSDELPEEGAIGSIQRGEECRRLVSGDRPEVVHQCINAGELRKANRAGEAEKSHLKARTDGYQHRWTIISLTGVSEPVVKEESPSTTLVFDVSQVLAETGPHYEEFKRQIVHLLGLPETTL